jgi:hypothetical protein
MTTKIEINGSTFGATFRVDADDLLTVEISVDGVWCGTGHLRGGHIVDYVARLNKNDETSEAIYEALEALEEAVAAEHDAYSAALRAAAGVVL